MEVTDIILAVFFWRTRHHPTKMLLRIVFDKTVFVEFKTSNSLKQNMDETHSKNPQENPYQPMDLKILRKKSARQKSQDFVIFKKKAIPQGLALKIYSLVYGFLFFMISISGRRMLIILAFHFKKSAQQCIRRGDKHMELMGSLFTIPCAENILLQKYCTTILPSCFCHYIFCGCISLFPLLYPLHPSLSIG